MTSPEEARIIAETEARIVVLLRKAVCEAVAGKLRPEFKCPTPAKANSVLAFAFAVLADMIERGDHRKDQTNA